MTVEEDVARTRLYRDLHDTLGSSLAGIRLRLDTLADRLAHDPEVHRMVVDAAAEATRTMEEVRRVVADVCPLDLQWGLPAALCRLAGRLAGFGVAIAVDVPERGRRLPRGTEVAAYRIGAEALTNALRHAAARQVVVRLRLAAGHVLLEVVDDGVGLPGGWGRGGSGLPSMIRRAEEAGGRCEVVARRDTPSGTLVRAVLPVPVAGPEGRAA